MPAEREQPPLPLAASQIFAVLSRLAVASRFPSGLNAMLLTCLVCPAEREQLLAAGGVPNPRRLVVAAVANRFPSGLNATLWPNGMKFIPSSCPRIVSSSRPLVAFQIFAVLSQLAVASRFPSRLKATLRPPTCMHADREQIEVAEAFQIAPFPMAETDWAGVKNLSVSPTSAEIHF